MVPSPRQEGRTDYPFGRQPAGAIIYLADGSMAVHIAGADDAQGKIRAYGGEWRLEGNCMVHEVEASLEPELCGVTLRRRAELEAATSTPIYRTEEAQGLGHPIVEWRK